MLKRSRPSNRPPKLPLFARYLLDEKHMSYVLSGKIQSGYLEKRFGRNRQLSGANYFASERQFIEAEKAIRMESLIKFSKYFIKEVCEIMKSDDNEEENVLLLHSEMRSMDGISEVTDNGNWHKELETLSLKQLTYHK